MFHVKHFFHSPLIEGETVQWTAQQSTGLLRGGAAAGGSIGEAAAPIPSPCDIAPLPEGGDAEGAGGSTGAARTHAFPLRHRPPPRGGCHAEGMTGGVLEQRHAAAGGSIAVSGG